MTSVSPKRVVLAAAVVACGVLASIQWTPGSGVTVSVDTAQARVGRPLTPVSAAGVARRTTRRAVVGAPACVRVLVNGVYVCR
jgi:hypothetical protein